MSQGSVILKPFLLVLFLEKSERTAFYIDMNLLTRASMVMWKCLLLLNSLLYIWIQDNNIVFWQKFVNEYFAPRAKKRWRVSLYGSGGQQPTSVFQQVSIELGSIFSSLLLNFLCNTVVSVSFPTTGQSLGEPVNSSNQVKNNSKEYSSQIWESFFYFLKSLRPYVKQLTMSVVNLRQRLLPRSLVCLLAACLLVGLPFFHPCLCCRLLFLLLLLTVPST